MSLALEQAIEAESAGEVPVGAVVVKGGQVIARGRNRTIEWNDPSAHAEVVALKEAARVCGTHRLSGLQLFVTLEPCAMCSGAIFHGRIARVVFGAADPKTGCAGSVLNLFAVDTLNHHAEVSGGVLSQECSDILVRFFERSRARKIVSSIPLREDSLRTSESRFKGLLSSSMPSHFHLGREGFRLHYRDVHPAISGKTVLCLHEFPYWSEQFVSLVSKFESSGWRTICPDLIGCGLSDKPKKAAWHSDEAHAGVLRDLLSHLNMIPQTIIALGASANIASALVQATNWVATKLVHLDRCDSEVSYRDAGKAHSVKTMIGPWRAGEQHFLADLSPTQYRVATAPFPDAGHTAIFKGRLHSSFAHKYIDGSICLHRPVSSNRFELGEEVEEALFRMVEQG
ncbi:tRNA adenosine(34) deaminase TadA [Rhodoferax mekongensis]|uniref:tRNA-specific adenosine deaminase n=1 Tax=Rhodoferax mekongensis TaxID=3068341 RepID=A0ABZ0AVK6_9BURK|nr:tRNA adenosine(34) deaminase TadA [Rhodoferax sp. TBRC 17307]WNO03638.1 tRNA adenosine(34) deaminase TadA [Rhodoferax sp. TBRC 17307]